MQFCYRISIGVIGFRPYSSSKNVKCHHFETVNAILPIIELDRILNPKPYLICCIEILKNWKNMFNNYSDGYNIVRSKSGLIIRFTYLLYLLSNKNII